jgi:MscS family membrane protein
LREQVKALNLVESGSIVQVQRKLDRFQKPATQQLVTFEILDTPVWRWIALVIMAVAIWIVAGWIAWALVAAVRPLVDEPAFRGPSRAVLAVAGLRWALEIAPPSTLPRLFLERALALLLSLAIAWAGAVVVDLLAKRWHAGLDPRVQAVSYSVFPLGRQILKVSLFLVAILTVISAWGYNTTTILAGLGVGGLAVALASQKTIENLFGGISVIGDRPVLVGDFCRFGDRTGTVMHIGLRSTRIRTPDRTVISVPNAQFSSMALENISGRDKIWFHPTLNLRRDTTSDQLLKVLTSFREILTSEPKVETGKLPVSGSAGVAPPDQQTGLDRRSLTSSAPAGRNFFTSLPRPELASVSSSLSFVSPFPEAYAARYGTNRLDRSCPL